MMEELDYGIDRFLIALAILFFTFWAGYIGGIWHETGKLEITARTGFDSEEERAEHLRLLRKHGLQYDVAFIYEDRIGKYFIRDGKRCAFK